MSWALRPICGSQVRDGAVIARDIWRRETRIEDVDGVRRLRILQRWDGVQSPPSRVDRDSVFEIDTFRPISHFRITTPSGGATTVEGFLFSETEVTGMPDLADNVRRDFHLPCAEPMFNFETDTEMLRTVPLEAGYSASIPHYHPGGGEPARYLWVVTGDAAVPGPDGGIACWIVQCDYNSGGASVSTFWVAKRSQLLLKMESTAPDGVIRRKTLLL